MAVAPSADSTETAWLRRHAALHPSVALPGYWSNLERNAATWAAEISAGPFWRAVEDKLDQWRTEYKQNQRADLLASPGLPSFIGKPETSIRSKLLRRYPLEPDEIASAFPSAGPTIPRIKDLVRVRVTCRYIDGVEYLAGKLEELAREMTLDPCRSREGRLEGYFAQHVNFSHDVFYRFAGQTLPAKIVCEIQLATELSTKMWDASHPFYEFSRDRTDAPETWQWQPSDPRFIANQLGHMIHLADGLLVNLRRAAMSRGER